MSDTNDFQTFVRGTFGHLNCRFDRLEGRFDRLEGRFNELERRFGELELWFDKLEARQDQVEARQDRVEAHLGSLEADLIKMRTDIMDRIDRLQSILISVQEDVGVNMHAAVTASNSVRTDYESLYDMIMHRQQMPLTQRLDALNQPPPEQRQH